MGDDEQAFVARKFGFVLPTSNHQLYIAPVRSVSWDRIATRVDGLPQALVLTYARAYAIYGYGRTTRQAI
jgi:hypothetical protein